MPTKKSRPNPEDTVSTKTHNAAFVAAERAALGAGFSREQTRHAGVAIGYAFGALAAKTGGYESVLNVLKAAVVMWQAYGKTVVEKEGFK